MAKAKTLSLKPAEAEEQSVVIVPEMLPLEEIPTAVRLEAPYAYYEDDGTLKNWAHGQVITDPAEITHLTERGARVVPHEVES